jgi:hypothetical protein
VSQILSPLADPTDAIEVSKRVSGSYNHPNGSNGWSVLDTDLSWMSGRISTRNVRFDVGAWNTCTDDSTKTRAGGASE